MEEEEIKNTVTSSFSVLPTLPHLHLISPIGDNAIF